MMRMKTTGMRALMIASAFGAISIAACAADDSALKTGPGTTDTDDARAPASDSDASKPEASTTPDAGDDAGGVCGDHHVDSTEECDDGNTKSDDGCSATCRIESAFDGDVCPGVALALTQDGANYHATVSGTTAGAYNHYGSNCGGGSGADVVYTFTPASSGKAIVKLTADFMGIVSARQTCADGKSELACGDIATAAGGNKAIEIPVYAGSAVSLFVDGYAGTSGNFTIDVTIYGAVCGNGLGELPEECDDGNLTNGDGCSSACKLESDGTMSNCPGQSFSLQGTDATTPRTIGFAGDTSLMGAPTQEAAIAYFDSGPNVVYALRADVAGRVKADLTTAYAKSNLHARSDCGDSDYQIGMSERVSAGKQSIEFPVKAGQWFWLLVDGWNSSLNGKGTQTAGPYTLDVKLTPAACGNHALDGIEECDDGNTTDGDGCSATCVLEAAPSADTCPGRPLTLSPRTAADGSAYESVEVWGTTMGLSDDLENCTPLGSTGSDAIYAVTPSISGRLDAKVTGAFNTALSIRSVCASDRTNVLACSRQLWIPYSTNKDPYILEGSGSVDKEVGTPVVAGQTYYVVVDSQSDGDESYSAGRYGLQLTVTPGKCGDGKLDTPETCDDGNTNSGDGCSSSCVLEAPVGDTCTDAIQLSLMASTDPAKVGTYEQSVQGNTFNLNPDQDFSTSTISAANCAARGADAFYKLVAPRSGLLQVTGQSDAFDLVLGFRAPTCALSGTPLSCSQIGGKGTQESLEMLVNAGETVYIVVDSGYPLVLGCTDKTWTNADCNKLYEKGPFSLDVTITPSRCGDGFFVASPTEECDDGNNVDGDGCSSTCKVEPPPAGIDTCPGYKLALTGTGTAPRKGKITVDTKTLTNDYSGACGGNAPDGVIKVTPDINGTLQAVATGMTNVTVHARSTCNDPSTEFPKSTSVSCSSVVHNTVTFAVTKNQDYYIFVDGLDGATGVASVDVTVSP